MSDLTGSRTTYGVDWRIRAFAGFVIAPVSLGLLVLPLREGVWALQFAAAIGYPIAIVIGLPLFILSKMRHWTGLISYLAFGVICSLTLATMFIFVPAFSQGESWGDVVSSSARWAQIILATFVSVFSVVLFWVIARPDRK